MSKFFNLLQLLYFRTNFVKFEIRKENSRNFTEINIKPYSTMYKSLNIIYLVLVSYFGKRNHLNNSD